MTNYLQQVLSLFKNMVLNATGAERDLYKLLEDKDVDRAIGLMQDRDKDVDEALAEYNPQKHKIMERQNKPRKNERPYITEKLPRTRQRYINETELFFLFGNSINWTMKSGDSDTFRVFQQFLAENYFDSRMRTAKRLAGAETESAKLYNIYTDEKDKQIKVNVAVLARSTGYKLRPMFDQFGRLIAFGYGYEQKQNGKTVVHWDIQTPDFLFYCQKGAVGWEVDMRENPTGKINVIYYRQTKAWEGAEPRIEREEKLDSVIGDTNNYFASPIAAATADVVEMMKDPESVGSLIKMTGDGSRFEYINPPQSSQLQSAEKDQLEKSILFDTFTPDFSFEALRGMGTLSGAAIRNSMILGYIKRARNIEVYDELVEREKNLILAILKYQRPELRAKLDELEIGYEFAEPFPDDVDTRWQRISNLYGAGLVSLETAVGMLNLTDDPDAEIDKLMLAAMEKEQGTETAQPEGETATEQPREQTEEQQTEEQ